MALSAERARVTAHRDEVTVAPKKTKLPVSPVFLLRPSQRDAARLFSGYGDGGVSGEGGGVGAALGAGLPSSFLAPAANRSVNSLPVRGGAPGSPGEAGGLSGSALMGDVVVVVGALVGVGPAGSAVGVIVGTGTGFGESPLEATAIAAITATTMTPSATYRPFPRFGRNSRSSIGAVAGNESGSATARGCPGEIDCPGMVPGGAGAVGNVEPTARCPGKFAGVG